MSNAPLVGMVGYAQAGKDTFAKFMGYKKIAFAGVLRDVAYDSSFQYRAAVLKHGYEHAKANVPGIREYLQDLGMAVREHLGQDAWVDAAFKDYDPSVATVVTDVRFPNEISKIKSLGGIIVRIDRKGHEPINNHISEHAWQASPPDEHFTFRDGALHHMELVAINLASRL